MMTDQTGKTVPGRPVTVRPVVQSVLPSTAAPPLSGRSADPDFMLHFLFHSLALLADGPAKGATEDSGGFGSLFSFSSPLLPMVMIGIVFYLMLMRPEQRKRKEMEQLLSNIKKNDKIILASGICGTVVNAAPKSVYVTIRVDDSTNTKLRVLRSAIARVGQPDETEADAKEAS